MGNNLGPEIEKLNLAKSVILTSSDLRLYGCLLYKFDIDIADSSTTNVKMPTAFVFFNEMNRRFHMIYFSEFIKEKTTNELVYVILHEITHVLNKHLTRGLNFNQEIFGIATDHVINKCLDEDIRNRILKGAATPNDRTIVNSLLKMDMTAESVYQYLLDHSTTTTSKHSISLIGDGTSSLQIKIDPNGEPVSESDENENPIPGLNNGPGDKQEIKIQITKTKITLDDGQTFEFISDFESNNKIKNESEKAENNLQGDARRLLNSSLFENENKKKGDGSSKILELIKDAIKVIIPWEMILEKVIKRNITEISDHKTWKRINRRMLATQHQAFPFNDMEETYDTIMIFIDTSGSVSKTELRKFSSIIESAMYHFKQVIKIDHDSAIYDKDKTIYDSTTIKNLVNEIAFKGRGGTSHYPVYEYIERIFKGDEEDVPEPGLILFLTDYESDIEQIHSKYKWVREYPYKFIISNTRTNIVSKEIDPEPIYILPT